MTATIIVPDASGRVATRRSNGRPATKAPADASIAPSWDHLAVDGVRAPTFASLTATLTGPGAGGTPLVADLTLGAWRGHQVGAEVIGQLGLPPVPEEQDGAVRPGTARSYADEIGLAVDDEASGDRGLRVAASLVDVVAACPALRGRTLAVLAPRFGQPWGDENLAFLRLLAPALRGSGGRLLLVATGDDAITPPGWTVTWRSAPPAAAVDAAAPLLARVPGTIEPSVERALRLPWERADAGLLALGGGWHLVAPEWRRAPAEAPREEYGWLAVQGRPVGWLAAFAQCFADPALVDPGFLTRQAYACYAVGSGELGLRLLDRAAEAATDAVHAAALRVRSQAMRIALLRFAEAAAARDPAAELPAPLRGALHQAKGWGLLMARQTPAAEAEHHLAEARRLLAPTVGRREHMYLLNISALSRLRLGDPDGALAFEREITAAIEALPRPDWPLTYINAINTARLYRRTGDLGRARHFYEKAFATTLGVRTENDAIYTAFTRSLLDEGVGRPEEAFLHCLEAALRWLASRLPEGMASRTAAAVVGVSWPPAVPPDPDRVADALVDRLLRLAAGAGLPGAPGLAAAARKPVASKVPRFLTAAVGPVAVRAGVMAGSAGLLLVDAPAGVGRDFAARRRLGRVVWIALRDLAGGALSEDTAALGIDDAFGHGLPATPAELLDVCVRLGAPELRIGRRRIRLDAAARRELERSSVVSLSPAVDRIESSGGDRTVLFKRCLAPRRLSTPEASALAAIGDGATLATLSSRRGIAPDARPIVRGLEQAHVVVVRSTAAGRHAFGLERLDVPRPGHADMVEAEYEEGNRA